MQGTPNLDAMLGDDWRAAVERRRADSRGASLVELLSFCLALATWERTPGGTLP